MNYRYAIAGAGLMVALPILVYLIRLSGADSISSDQVIFLAFAFSVTFPTLILLSLMLFRSLTVMLFALPVYMACIIAGYARTFMAFGILCDGKATDTLADALYFSVAAFTNTGCADCVPTPALRLMTASEAFFGYISLGAFSACLIVILVRLITANKVRR